MKSWPLKIMLPVLLGSILMAGAAMAQTVDYDFHWAPSPVVDGDGIVRPEAVAYQVYVKRGSAAVELVATVSDTLYTLIAKPGIVQRLQVRAVDDQGRFSSMSVESDPVYFEATEEEVRGLPGVPPVAELGDNYPNPFNPETRVVYGVPDNLTGSENMRLDIYNLQGQLIRRLDVDPTPGWHEVRWDGKDDSGMVSSTGMYLTRFVVGSTVTTAKMTMVK